MSNLYLIAVVADIEIAINSDCIESVVTVGDVIAVPKCDPLVAGLMAMRSRVLTLVDCQYAVTGCRKAALSQSHAVIVDVGGHSYAFAVDAVRDVVSVEPENVRTAPRLDARWTNLAKEIAEIDGRILMILSPEMLLTPALALAA